MFIYSDLEHFLDIWSYSVACIVYHMDVNNAHLHASFTDMKGVEPVDFHPEVTQHVSDSVCDASDILNSTEVEGDDLGLSGYVQDNFEFLDQMDCSGLDHMDCSVPYQVRVRTDEV